MTTIKVCDILQMLMGNMSEAALARAINLPKATIHRVLSGVTPDPRAGTLLPIAQYFNITIEQLMGITELPSASPLQAIATKNAIEMPFIPFEKFGEWLNEQYKPEKFYNITSFSNKTIDVNCFITKMNSDEMLPLFSNGTYLIIKKQRLIQNNDIILVLNMENDTFIVRKYIELKGDKYLFSTNPTYEIINFGPKMRLIGVILEGRIII